MTDNFAFRSCTQLLLYLTQENMKLFDLSYEANARRYPIDNNALMSRENKRGSSEKKRTCCRAQNGRNFSHFPRISLAAN